MNRKKIDSLIFDLDGTLWDAAGACAKAWNEALKQFGNENYVIEEDLVRSISGLKIDKVMQQCFHFIPAEKHEELLSLYKLHEKNFMKQVGGELYPQVKETLSLLQKNYRLFIVSNCLSGYIENFLSFHNIHPLFNDFECSGNTGLAKSENIRLIIERNKLSHPVYIGDTVWDAEAAKKAAVPFVYAAYGFGNVEQAEWCVSSFADLQKLFSATATEDKVI